MPARKIPWVAQRSFSCHVQYNFDRSKNGPNLNLMKPSGTKARPARGPCVGRRRTLPRTCHFTDVDSSLLPSFPSHRLKSAPRRRRPSTCQVRQAWPRSPQRVPASSMGTVSSALVPLTRVLSFPPSLPSWCLDSTGPTRLMGSRWSAINTSVSDRNAPPALGPHPVGRWTMAAAQRTNRSPQGSRHPSSPLFQGAVARDPFLCSCGVGRLAHVAAKRPPLPSQDNNNTGRPVFFVSGSFISLLSPQRRNSQAGVSLSSEAAGLATIDDHGI
jgi:hypothetical protein